MEEESVYNSFPELKEFENKIGTKTPNVILRWMKDAARRTEESSECLQMKENGTGGECLNDKINHLKFEMECLRAADVQILRQLVVVHEGMEAVRWLLEEQGTLASSSPTGSQCSLADSAPGMSPGEGPSPTLTGIQDPTKPRKEPEQEPDRVCSSHSYFNMTTDKSPDKRPPSDLALCFSTGGSGQIWPSTSPCITTTTHPVNTKQLCQQDPLQQAPQWTGLESKRTVFSRDTGRGVAGGGQVQTGETGTAHCSLPEETLRASASNTEDKEQSVPSCEMLLGYDAQWCWVESQDDVTFL
ncbi:leucine rich adaptor protein 1-like [Osmerus eperlanus]|uniref:leucine rich adaptor protein 1-like n=1 Tax=Osmerus eperlanus TaxID=29151 RepID=UPI002E0E48C2